MGLWSHLFLIARILHKWGMGYKSFQVGNLEKMLPDELQKLINKALIEVNSDPLHNLSPVTRVEIYRTLEPTVEPPQLCLKRGWLGFLTAKHVLPIWEEVIPLWGAEEDNPSIQTDLLPQHFLDLTEKLLSGAGDIQSTWNEANDYWYEVGNITEMLFEDFDEQYHHTAFVFHATLLALLEAMGSEFLINLKNWQNHDDDFLSNTGFAADTASAALAAYIRVRSGKNSYRKKRLEFWEWWLNEAIPQAWELASNTLKDTE